VISSCPGVGPQQVPLVPPVKVKKVKKIKPECTTPATCIIKEDIIPEKIETVLGGGGR
jgi:hypothetical protein